MNRPVASIVALLLCLAACDRQPVAPAARDLEPSLSRAEETGPPSPRSFGPDTRETEGPYTGQGIESGPRLRCDAASGARRFDGFLESHVDRTLLDATLELPAGTAPYPLVVLLHGWAGSKTGSSDIAESLLAQGYAVLRYSARGFGDSWGRVNLADVGVEIADLQSMITRIAEQADCGVNADAVAVTGASYGGGQSWLAAVRPLFKLTAESPEVRIRTIVPIVAWTDLLYSLLPNGRPRNSIDGLGALKWSYANALFFSGQREPGDGPDPWYDNYPAYLREWHASLTTLEPTLNPFAAQIRDGIAGYRSIWWQQTFWSTVASNRIPVFQVQGFTDDLFTLEEAKRMLLALKTVDAAYPIASYFGDIGHPRARNDPLEVEYALGLIRSWLAYYLKGDGAQPPHVIYAAVTAHSGERFNPSDVITVASWQELATSFLTQKFTQKAVLVNPASGAPSGPFRDPVLEAGLVAAGELEPFPGTAPQPDVPDPTVVAYRVPAAALSGGSGILVAGQPTATLWVTTTAPRVQLNLRLYDVAPTGMKELITRGTYTIDTALGVSPLGDYKITITTAGNLWRVAAGHTLLLEVTNNDFPYLAPSQIASVTEITKLELTVPAR